MVIKFLFSKDTTQKMFVKTYFFKISKKLYYEFVLNGFGVNEKSRRKAWSVWIVKSVRI